jgi:hypothetical protein
MISTILQNYSNRFLIKLFRFSSVIFSLSYGQIEKITLPSLENHPKRFRDAFEVSDVPVVEVYGRTLLGTIQ